MRAKREYKKSEASRDQVIEAAIRELSKRGYGGTSVSDIAAAARMSKGVVHYHFASKDDLIIHVLQRCCARMSERVRAAWAVSGTPLEKIRSALHEMWHARTDGSPEIRVLTDLMAQGVHDAKLRKPLAAAFAAMRAELTREVDESLSAIGLTSRLPPTVIPRLVTATLDGLALHHLFDPPSKEEEEQTFRAIEAMAMALFQL